MATAISLYGLLSEPLEASNASPRTSMVTKSIETVDEGTSYIFMAAGLTLG
ncbi:MAG: hypothetical protein Q8M73_06210 [Actinomycetota bacterium]|nr:hypothetical protein [Actinomycetota bacterium]